MRGNPHSQSFHAVRGATAQKGSGRLRIITLSMPIHGPPTRSLQEQLQVTAPPPKGENPQKSSQTGLTTVEIPKDGEERPSVSVIIPTLNTATTLRKCLASIGEQTYRTTETIVVDGGSNDATMAIAGQTEARIFRGPFRRSTARRLGAAQANGAFFLFLDADQILEPSVVEECVMLCRTEEAGAVVIPEDDLGSGVWAECRRLDRYIALVGGLSYPRFISRWAYEAVSGHAEDLEDYMEDRDLCLRLREASVKFAQCQSRIFNSIGKINPFALGVKGVRSATDAPTYYRRNRERNESLGRVIRPRVAAFFRCSRALPRFTITGLLLFPIYLTVAYGPRYLKAAASQ